MAMSLPFVPAFVWYAFASIATWTRLPAFEMPQLDEAGVVENGNQIGFERLSSVHPLNLTNSLAAYQRQRHLALFTVCGALGGTALSYQWAFAEPNGRPVDERHTENCAIRWQAPREGTFVVTLTARRRDSVVLRARRSIRFVDFWIVAVGDSFAAGEGSPNEDANSTSFPRSSSSQWLSEKCHRSTKSFPFLVYKRLMEMTRSKFAVHFTFLACSGAAVDGGSLSLLAQLDAVEEIRRERGKRPELLLMTAGGNDAGFTEVLGQLLRGHGVSRARSRLRLHFVAHQLERVAERIDRIAPSQVILPTYFQFGRNDRGELDVDCEQMHGITKRGLRSAELFVLKPLNELIEATAKRRGWTAVPEVTRLFDRGGLCARRPLIRSVDESARLQGDSGGSFHPNAAAHSLISDLIFSKLKFSEFLTSN
ncbi:hypothetical protein M3Y99_01089200 [Aphelenchoides fujianensis]|nr:hypothetical protein M3Y99_01089200 [Aphelenchoides fujianensis]